MRPKASPPPRRPERRRHCPVARGTLATLAQPSAAALGVPRSEGLELVQVEPGGGPVTFSALSKELLENRHVNFDSSGIRGRPPLRTPANGQRRGSREVAGEAGVPTVTRVQNGYIPALARPISTELASATVKAEATATQPISVTNGLAKSGGFDHSCDLSIEGLRAVEVVSRAW